MHAFKIYIKPDNFSTLKNAFDQWPGSSVVEVVDMSKDPWFGNTRGLDLRVKLECSTLQDIFFLGMKYQREKGEEDE